jgi:hypothetical protein
MSTFPPASIAVHTESLVDNCELVEMTPGTDPAVPVRRVNRSESIFCFDLICRVSLPLLYSSISHQVVELAALLYLGDYIPARHLWRRHRDAAPPAVKAALEDWWNLGRALMEHKPDEIWARIHHLQQSHPKPYCDYAREVGERHMQRLILKVAALWQKPTDVLLGIPRSEWVAFLEKYRKTLAASTSSEENGRDITDTISFFESPALIF